MKYQFAVALLALSQLPTGSIALHLPENAVAARAVGHIDTLPNAEEVAQHLTFPPSDKKSKREEESLPFAPLEKRKGGGGGGKGGGGGGGGGSSSGGGSGSGGKGGGSSGGSGSGSGGGYRSPGYSSGYRTYGGRYGGGSPTPYRAGGRSPLGIAPFLLPLAALSIFPGIWLWSVYSYPFHTPYYYYNQATNQNQSIPVQCLCQQYSDCGCDDNGDTTYLTDLVNLNQSNTTHFATVNGTYTLLINGTLANGTTNASSAGTLNANPKFAAMGYAYMVGVVLLMVYAM